MKFVPPPRNDFLDFMHEYHRRCKAKVPQICAVAAKWRFEDLIPGLSDFDTRFIVSDGMSTADWQTMSVAVGQVHTDMCREYPHWARNLEHLPGINLTVAEIINPSFFYPEFQQWTFYEGESSIIERIKTALAGHQWSAIDESHQLKRFATYCGPYQRGIDPPVNVAPWEDKYALHSRFMHYFAPAVQAAGSLVMRHNIAGKTESLRTAREIFPGEALIDLIFASIGDHYDNRSLYEPDRLAELEREMAHYLQQAWATCATTVTLVEPDAADTAADIRGKVAAVARDPAQEFFDGVKFGRLLRGRLLFYSEQIPWFDCAWLIRNEFARMVSSFYGKPLKAYGQLRWGSKLSPEQVLDRLEGNLLTASDCAAMRDFAAVAARPIDPGDERAAARELADRFTGVLDVMEKLWAQIAHGSC